MPRPRNRTKSVKPKEYIWWRDIGILNGGRSPFACEVTVDAPGKPPLLVLLAVGVIVYIGQADGDSRVGSQQSVEVVLLVLLLVVRILLEVEGEADADEFDISEDNGVVAAAEAVKFLLEGNVRTNVVETT